MHGFETIDQIKFVPLGQCFASYLGDLGKFSMGFSVVFHASTGKKLHESKVIKYGMRKFVAKRSAFLVKISPKVEVYKFLWELYNDL